MSRRNTIPLLTDIPEGAKTLRTLTSELHTSFMGDDTVLALQNLRALLIHLCDITLQVNIMHRQLRVIHRNINPDLIVLTTEGRWEIINIQTARKEDERKGRCRASLSVADNFNTARFVPSEVRKRNSIDGQYTYTFLSDIHALGVVFSDCTAEWSIPGIALDRIEVDDGIDLTQQILKPLKSIFSAMHRYDAPILRPTHESVINSIEHVIVKLNRLIAEMSDQPAESFVCRVSKAQADALSLLVASVHPTVFGGRSVLHDYVPSPLFSEVVLMQTDQLVAFGSRAKEVGIDNTADFEAYFSNAYWRQAILSINADNKAIFSDILKLHKEAKAKEKQHQQYQSRVFPVVRTMREKNQRQLQLIENYLNNPTSDYSVDILNLLFNRIKDSAYRIQRPQHRKCNQRFQQLLILSKQREELPGVACLFK